MGAHSPSRTVLVAGTLGLAAVTGSTVATGRPMPVVGFLVTATVVSAVGTSRVVAEVAPWYYVLQSVLLATGGVGLVLLGYGSPLVFAVTGGLVLAGALWGASYRRARRTVPPPEENAP